MMLYVVRHGETQFNVEKRYAGQTDVPLNERGIEQAKELAKKLVEERFDVIVVSPLQRARATAEQIWMYHKDVPLVVMDDFREVCVGVYEGLAGAEAKEKYPDKNVLLVCHGFVSRTINRQMKGLSFEEMHEFSLGNCEVIKYEM